MMYQEARQFISKSNQYGCVPGLETITELLKRLGNPHEELTIIHVAGTNGKGSTCAFLATILATAGYRVGRYISPAVFSYLERIQIVKSCVSAQCNKQKIVDDCTFYHTVSRNQSVENRDLIIETDNITEKGVSDTIALIMPACEAMVVEGFAHPTSFEIETAMTMLYLKWEQVDFVILEVGLGGRLDATNVIKHPVCSVITSISMDHMQILGDTLELIAREKAGIIKKGSPVISYKQEPEVTSVLRQASLESGAPFTMVDFTKIKDILHSMEQITFLASIEEKEQSYLIKLLGENQVKNAFLAIHVARVLEELGYPIGEECIHKGLENTRWSGRFEVVDKKPFVIIDGAHNENAAKSLHKSIKLYFTNRKIIFIMGVLADKDYKSILRHTASLAEVIITLTPNNSRALSSAVLAQEAKQYCNQVVDAGDVAQAVQLAYQEAGEEDVIIAFGSLSYLGDLVGALRMRKGDNNYDE